MLLTTYAFSHLGDLGNETADTLFALAGNFLLAAIVAGLLRLRKKAGTSSYLAPSGGGVEIQAHRLEQVSG